VVYGPALAGPRAELGQRWMVAYARGVREYTDLLQRPGGRQELAGLRAAHLPIRDLPLYERMSYVDLGPTLRMDEPRLAEPLAWATQRGLVTGSIDLSRANDSTYVQHALGRLGSQP
jgi:NitT/TauT family transport system substrate-binding protein